MAEQKTDPKNKKPRPPLPASNAKEQKMQVTDRKATKAGFVAK